MFAGLFTKIGVYLIIGLVLIGIFVGGYAYIESEKVQISNLQASVSTLQTSNKAEQDQITHLIKDMAVVQKAQSVAQKTISDANIVAKTEQQAIRSKNLNKSAQMDTPALQKQLNDASKSTFSAWEEISK